MSRTFVSFDEVRARAKRVLDGTDLPNGIPNMYLVRDMFGRLGVSAPSDAASDERVRSLVEELACRLNRELGAHGRAIEAAVLWVDAGLLEQLNDTARPIAPGVYWADRLLVGRDWWTVGDRDEARDTARYVLYSVKGGVGRSTTAAVLAWHLARQGEEVLVVDLDIESPGLASVMLDDRAQPTFGVVDWFVEELVGQGDQVVEQMVARPAWAHELPGSAMVAPAHGAKPGDYLAKLGRVYVDTLADPWTKRLARMLEQLEERFGPSVVLLESRSGLHDVAAAAVTDLDAEVLLFGMDSPSNWTDYAILFDHWASEGLATRIRDRLSIVSALTPATDTTQYLEGYREKAWNLFRDRIYDEVTGTGDHSDAFSYDLSAEEAPHSPMAVHWNRGLAAGASLQDLEQPSVATAYSDFLARFDRLRRDRKTRHPSTAAAERIDDVRIALSGLPEGTSHGGTLAPRNVYLPPSHRKAMDPNVMLVTGMRGSGKTFWWTALQNPRIRTLLAQAGRHSPWTEESEVSVGFGVSDSPDDYPGPDELQSIVRAGIEPRIIWKTIHACQLADAYHPLRESDAWSERSRYVSDNPGLVARLFHDRDVDFDERGIYHLVLFDALDRSSEAWPTMFRFVRGLLQHALDMRSYRKLRVKVFLRSDQVDEQKVADFPDASKVLSAAVELTWPRRDLYGLLWQYLANGERGDQVRPWMAADGWSPRDIGDETVFDIPRALASDEKKQREQFHAITGPWMGTDRRRGFPYTWIPNHLGDARSKVSPRSFIAALRKAAEDTAERYPDHEYALHYESVKRGVQEASMIRVRELREDYPWVDRLLVPLEGIVVPCDFSDIERRWQEELILDKLLSDTSRNETRLPPRNIEQREAGAREDLESLRVFRRLRDGRVDIPDVFRVGYGLGRKGGVRPVT